MADHRAGEVRPSQLLWTYGPGAMLDLPNISVMVMGIDFWKRERCMTIAEARLLDAVRRYLGPQVEALKGAPLITDEKAAFDPKSEEAYVGVGAAPFPEMLRCVKCQRIGTLRDGAFKVKPNFYRPENMRFYHDVCMKGDKPDAVPMRFLVACRDGHLDDFPWSWFVHEGHSECKGPIIFYEDGASLQTENLKVKCQGCNKLKSMARAFGEEGLKNLPACRGRHPHLNHYDDECKKQLKPVLLGASNAWFPVNLSALSIPSDEGKVMQFVENNWNSLQSAKDETYIDVILNTLRNAGVMGGFEDLTTSQVWQGVQEQQAKYGAGGEGGEEGEPPDIRGPEWRVLIKNPPPREWPEFMGSRTDVPANFTRFIDSVVLVERLREVNALIGFTRIEPPEETHGEEPPAKRARISIKDRPDWVPANEVRGEGIFIRLDENAVSAWEEREEIKARESELLAGHKLWRAARNLSSDEKGFPGIRYVMLHTLAHVLIRELALECGYSAASIRERIYSGENDRGEVMAGVLLYTAAPDSDGTLGGLVQQGLPDNLGPHIDNALKRARICSSDPLCSEHDPKEDRSLHGATCHACGFVAETSCEKTNRYLDRALIVPTFQNTDLAFFES